MHNKYLKIKRAITLAMEIAQHRILLHPVNHFHDLESAVCQDICISL
jgi:hypothetical protein